MSRFACRLPPVGLLLPAAALLAAAPVPDVPDRRPPHQVEAARQLLAKLKKEAAAPKVDVDALWKLWQQMRLEHGGSPECLAAAAVMSKAPSPLDRLDRNQIPAEDRLPWLPKEVVAVLGEHRGRHWGAVWEVVVSPDGALVISAAVDGLRMWDAGTMHEVQAFPDYLVATFSPDGRTVALAHRSDGTVRLFDRRGGKLTQRLVLHCKRLPERMNERDRWADEARKEKGVRPSAQEMRFDDDGKRLIAVCNDQALRAWDLTGKEPLEKTAHDTHRFGNRLVLLSGNCLAAFGGAKENSLWEVNGITIRRRGELPMGTQPVALRPDGKMLATGVGGPGPISLRLLDLSGKAPRVSRDLLDIRGLRAVAFAPDGRLLASLDADRVLRLWPLDEAKRQELRLPRQATHRASPLSFPATCLVFLPDGKTLALGGDDGTVRLWDLAKSAERFPTRGHTGRVLDVAFSPDGKVLASLGDDRTVRLWDLTGAGPKERAVLKRQGVGVASVAFAAGRPLLAVAETPIEGSDAVPKGNVRVWDLSGDAPKERFAFQAHSHGVTGVAFSPDGRRLITAGRDVALPQGKDDVDPALVTIGLWEIKDGKAMGRWFIRPKLKADGDKLRAYFSRMCDVSSDGKLLCFVVRQQLLLWDIANGPPKGRAALKVGYHQMPSAAFSPDSKSLATASYEIGEEGDKYVGRVRVRLWDLGGSSCKVRYVFPGHMKGDVGWVGFTPDGAWLITVEENRSLLIWSVATGRKRHAVRLPGELLNMAMAPDGRHLATANLNGTIYILPLDSFLGMKHK